MTETTHTDGPRPSPRSSLNAVRPLAIAALVTMIAARVLAPSIQGLVVGIDRIVHAADLGASAITQAVAIAMELSLVALLTAVGSTSLRVPLRFGAIVLGALVVLIGLSASRAAAPEIGAEIMAGAAALLAAIGAVASFRAPFARLAASAVGASAIGALFRVGSVALALHLGQPRASNAARALATMELVCDAAAIALAMGFVARGRRRDGGAASPFDPLVLVALGLALFATRAALLGAQDDPGALNLLLHRAAQVLAPEPLAWGPRPLSLFVAFVAPLLAIACLVRRVAVPAMAGAVALALAARAAADVPLAALGLAAAGVALVLVASDPAAIWTALDDGR